MPQHVNYQDDDWKQREYICACGWRGTCAGMSAEYFKELMELSCPSCKTPLLVVTIVMPAPGTGASTDRRHADVDGLDSDAETTQPRIIAIDWSGRRDGEERAIWLTEAGSAGLTMLRCGWTRASVVEFLERERRPGRPMIVGMDFAFSLPAWYLSERRLEDAPALWRWLADGRAEEILEICEHPFWGRPGKTRPSMTPQREYRLTEQNVNIGGIRPKSVFQIGGAGAVGTGSLRGMPFLERLRTAGFSIWPFSAPGEHTVVEIYPRLLTGVVNKSSREACVENLSAFPEIGAELRQIAASSEDAFDAAVSALVMWRYREQLLPLPTINDPAVRIEGQIWQPTEAAVDHTG
jgi:hypothetical protein